MSGSASSSSSMAIFTAVAVASVGGLLWKQKRGARRTTVPDYKEYTVPLPDGVVNMLNAARLCTLATNFNGPHLSLMNFTYFRPDEVLVLCTRRNTKKYELLTKNCEVAVLINDFPLLRSENGLPGAVSGNGCGGGSSCSITLNGTAEALEDTSPLSIKYRAAHKANNAEYAHFIEGPDIAVIVIRFDTARICDFKDQVMTWARGEAV